MRVLFVHNDYGKWSGEEASAEALAKLLTDHGHQVSWFRRSSRDLYSSLNSKANAFLAGIHNPFAARDIAHMLDEVGPDIVQVQNLYPLLSPSILGPIRKRGIPIVMRCPNYRLFCPNGRNFTKGHVCERCTSWGRELWCVLNNCEGNFFKSMGYSLRNAWARLTRRIIDGVDIFIVQTHFQKTKFVKNGLSPKSIEILPGMVPSIDSGDSTKIGDSVVYIGRISEEKGIGALLRAAEITPRIPYSIAGVCTTASQYKESAANNVRWLGFLKGEALLDLYRSARFVVIPSIWYEGFPNVITRSMTMRKPVISSMIGGIPEIIDNGITGLLCEPNNAKDLAEKIQYLWNRPQLCKQMGQAGREKALRDYSPDKCYERVIAIYQKAISLGGHAMEIEHTSEPA
jgi:glycosyltransferase involved in cell wall biosynthesis